MKNAMQIEAGKMEERENSVERREREKEKKAMPAKVLGGCLRLSSLAGG